jgi:diguanylate cyclase (GGDEF)-like protein/PAS domain S-box-containing protein
VKTDISYHTLPGVVDPADNKSVYTPPGDISELFQQSPKILASLSTLFMEVTDCLRIQRIFPSSYQFTVHSPEELLGSHISRFLTPPQFYILQKKLQACLTTGKNQRMDLWLAGSDDNKCLQMIICPFSPHSVLFIGNDVSSVRKAHQELDLRIRFYSFLINNTSDMITVVSKDGTIVYESPAIRSVLGVEEHEIIGISLNDAIHSCDWETVKGAVFQTPPDQISTEFEFRRKHQNGNWVYLEGLATNLLGDEAIQGIIINARNITERKKFEQEQQKHLFLDPLTQLANRNRLLDRLTQAIRQTRREPAFQFALILINLDRFKAINKTLGWELGDQFLIRVAQMLKVEFREVDTIARIGSDEFGLLISGFSDGRAPIRVAERLKEKAGKTFVLKGQEIPFSASIGIAYGSAQYIGGEQLINDASTAMYKAKADYSTAYRIFHSKMHIQTLNLLQLENELRKAVDRHEFEIHYQPILDLVAGRMVSLEALIRWRHPQKGLVPPDRFIPLAEDTGLILPIGKWVIERACREILLLNGRRTAPCMLSVNLSARQLSDPELYDQILGLLNQTGFPRRLLQLEVTESALIHHGEDTVRLFKRFKKGGLKLAIDDFGTGYSSLKYLHDYPFDTLKIDRSFIRSLNGKVNKNEKIIQSIMTLAGNLDLRVIAEGIEKPHQMNKMRALNCRYAQGFLFSRPLPMPRLIETFATTFSSATAL